MGGKKTQRQGSSYEAPGAAALNHCLKPPAQVEGAFARGGVDGPCRIPFYSVWDVWLLVSRGKSPTKIGELTVTIFSEVPKKW